MQVPMKLEEILKDSEYTWTREGTRTPNSYSHKGTIKIFKSNLGDVAELSTNVQTTRGEPNITEYSFDLKVADKSVAKGQGTIETVSIELEDALTTLSILRTQD